MKKLTDYSYHIALYDSTLSFEQAIKSLVDDISFIYQLPKRTVKKLIVSALASNYVHEAIFDQVQYILGDE